MTANEPVVVAFVVVERVAVRLAIVVEPVARRFDVVTVPDEVMFPPEACVNERFDTNEFVEVAEVVVERVTLSRIVAPANVLLSVRSVDDAELPAAPIHVPLIA